MNRKLSIGLFQMLILHFLFFSLISADTFNNISWIKKYGDYRYDEEGTCIQQTNDGGFIVAGSIELTKILMIRMKDNGDILWTKTYDGQARYVLVANDGGFFVVGSTTKVKLYLMRTDSNGDTLWTKTYSEDNEGYFLEHTNDGGFIILCGGAREDIDLTRVKSNGDLIWTKNYYHPYLEIYYYGYSIQQTSDSGFIIGGANCNYEDLHYNDVFLMKTNPDGDTLWTKRYGEMPTEETGRSVLETSDGGFFVLGNTAPHNNLSESNIWLIRTNNVGDTLWTKTYGDSGAYCYGYSMQHAADGGFIIAGTKGTENNRLDLYLMRTDSVGDTLWTKTHGEYSLDYGYCVQQTDDGGFIVVGETSDDATDWDVYIIRTNANGEVNIKNNFYNNIIDYSDFIVSNNHGNVAICYSIPNSSPVKIEAYTIQGKLVEVLQDKYMQQGSYSIKWNIKRFGSGIYFLKFTVNGSNVSKKIVIAK